MDATQVSNSLPQGFSIFQPALGAQLQFFPAVGTKELDDMINAYLPGPASMQEKRATVTVDFLSYTQLTGETFKFYPVYSVGTFAESPVSDSVSSFNASPATSSWDWSQSSGSASMSSSRSSANARQSRQSPPSTVSRHQTADFSHLPGMKIMTKDGRDVTNSASRGSKTKEQRDHAHLMRIIKACDSCRRKKIRCDPSHKKRSASSQAQPSQSSKPAKRAARSSPPQAQRPTASPPIVGEDSFLTQVPIDWDASFTFDDLEIPDFTMPFESVDEFATQASLMPNDYDFFFDPKGYLSPQTSFASSSSSTSSSKQPSPLSQPLEDPSSSGSGLDYIDSSAHSMYVPFDNSSGSVDTYHDFNLYSPASSFSEDEHMVSIEASSERFSTKSQSQSPIQQSQSQSPGDPSQLSPDGSLGVAWFNDGDAVDWSYSQQPSSSAAQNISSHEDDLLAPDKDEFYDAEWLCAPRDQQGACAPGLKASVGQGAGNADLMEAYESTVSSDGVLRKSRRVQTVRISCFPPKDHRLTPRKVTHSSINLSTRSSTTTETVRASCSPLQDHQLTPRKVTHSSTNSSSRFSTTTEPVRTCLVRHENSLLTLGKESTIHRGPASVEAALVIQRGVCRDREVMSVEFVLTCKKVTVPSTSSLSEHIDQTRVQTMSVQPATAAHTTDVGPSRSADPSIRGSLVVQSPSSVETAGINAVSPQGGDVRTSQDIQSTLRPGSGRYQSDGASLASQGDVGQPSPSMSQIQEDISRVEDIHSGTTLQTQSTPDAIASSVAANVHAIHRSVGGVGKPVVSALAPLSSHVAMLVMCVALLWFAMRGPSAAFSMLSVAALAIHMGGVTMVKDARSSRFANVRDLCGSTLSQNYGKSSRGPSVCSGSQRPWTNPKAAPPVGRLLAL
jgi:hypothetical protein